MKRICNHNWCKAHNAKQTQAVSFCALDLLADLDLRSDSLVFVCLFVFLFVCLFLLACFCSLAALRERDRKQRKRLLFGSFFNQPSDSPGLLKMPKGALSLSGMTVTDQWQAAVQIVTDETQVAHRRLDIQNDLIETMRRHLLVQDHGLAQLQTTVCMLQASVCELQNAQVCLCVCLFVRLLVCLFVCLLVCLFVCL
jgi:hypothetical protein